MKTNNLPASFRDPSGFVFKKSGKILRQINYYYKDNYDFLIKSGLYKKLVNQGYLIPHKEIKLKPGDKVTYKIIEPQLIPFISYPYEWSFSQLKDAALLTLDIQKISLEFGMSLKDATSFNIQFLNGKPVLIDTLSFEKYEISKPWIAYKQFCEQFLAPLTLASYTDIRLNKLLEDYLGNIPLDLAIKLLPFKAKCKISLFLHLVLHAKSQQRFASSTFSNDKSGSFNKNSFLELIDSLKNCINRLKFNLPKTVWTNYSDKNNTASYQETSLEQKKIIIQKYLEVLNPKTILDIGANTGIFSRLAQDKKIFSLSIDNDPSVVEQNYLLQKRRQEKNILPLWVDIVNPTPGLGWQNKERTSFLDRLPPLTVLALAIIHHLAIANNLPLDKIAYLLNEISDSLIIEFIPKTDKQTQLLLKSRRDIFTEYTQTNFEKEFGVFFKIKNKIKLTGSERIIYLMIKK